VLLDEGNGGGMGGASLRLHPSGRHAERQQPGRSGSVVSSEEDGPGWAITGPGGLDPKADWASLMLGKKM
jgi:hypothetical protein